jgi:hypothetical protein
MDTYLSIANLLLTAGIAFSQVLLFKKIKDYEVLSGAKLEASKELFKRQLDSLDKVMEYTNKIEFYRLSIYRDEVGEDIDEYIKNLRITCNNLNDLFVNKMHYFNSVMIGALNRLMDNSERLLDMLDNKSYLNNYESYKSLNHELLKAKTKIFFEIHSSLSSINVLYSNEEYVRFVNNVNE